VLNTVFGGLLLGLGLGIVYLGRGTSGEPTFWAGF
jgi:uncharacterized membrane-anchored protein YitT (DUF2179 family)